LPEEKTSIFKAFKEIFAKSREEEDKEFTEEITELIDEGEEKGLITPEEGEMIINILQVRNIPVREVMVPRKDIVALEVGMDFKQLVAEVTKNPHTRYPVYQKDLDHIRGVVHIKDLFRFCGSAEAFSLRSLCREAYIVPENIKVRDLLSEFRKRREQFAIVIDESGVVSGLVTLRDIFLEIMGDEAPVFPKDAAGWYILEGTVRIDDVEKALQVEIPRGPYETISGFIIEKAGRLPEEGERFRFDDLELEILAADERRIKKIRARKVKA